MMKRFIKLCIAIMYKIRYINKCRIHAWTSIILRKCEFEGNNAFGNHVYLSASSFGFGSYTGNYCEFSNCKIGRFCSIGNYVKVVSANHPISDNIATHPAFYSAAYYFSYAHQPCVIEHLMTLKGYECEIGNDVWIGDNVLIKGGVNIGDGAVIGMGSVITKDVEPYSVVVGVPAKTIKKRFSDKEIEQLLKLKWWDKPLEWIEKHSKDFSNPVLFFEYNHIDKIDKII